MNDLGDREKGGGLAWAALKIGAMVLLFIGLVVWLSSSFIRKTGPEQSEAFPPVDQQPSTFRVERRVFPSWVEQVGTVRAPRETKITSRIVSAVREIRVREGDFVSAGESGGSSSAILAVLDDAQILDRMAEAESRLAGMEREVEIARARLMAIRAQVESARASVERVVSDYRHYEGLNRMNAATAQRLEHARVQKDMVEARLRALLSELQSAEKAINVSLAQRQQAEAAVREARWMLDHTVIRAPFPGRVIRIAVEPGDTAVPGEPLIHLERPFRPELHVQVSESVRRHLLPGQELDVHIDTLERSFRGRVLEIYPEADPSTGMVLVRMALPHERDLVNGMVGRIRVPQGEVRPVVIPRAALQEEKPPVVIVWHAEKGGERRSITLGAERGDLVEVRSGLDEGEAVVVP